MPFLAVLWKGCLDPINLSSFLALFIECYAPYRAFKNLWRAELNKLTSGIAEAEGKSLDKTVGEYHPPIFPDVFLKAVSFLQGALSDGVPYSAWCSEQEAV